VLSSFVSTKPALNWGRSVLLPGATSPVSSPLQTKDGLFSPLMLAPRKDFFSSALKMVLKPFPVIRKTAWEQSPSLLPPESVSLGQSHCFRLQPRCAPRQLPGLAVSLLSGASTALLHFHCTCKHRVKAAPITYVILTNLNKCCMYTGQVSF